MKYLLDTHVVIWHFEDSSDIPDKITDIIKRNANKLFISSVSLWEIAIKMSTGKLKMSFLFSELLLETMKSDINILQIENKYLYELFKLPFIHKDPFDRLLISAAIAEDMTIITKDENIKKYDVSWVW
jgi:PIN domain nuclease of toxin-antitoxin system